MVPPVLGRWDTMRWDSKLYLAMIFTRAPPRQILSACLVNKSHMGPHLNSRPTGSHRSLHVYNMHVDTCWEATKVLVRSSGPSSSPYWLCDPGQLPNLSEL